MERLRRNLKGVYIIWYRDVLRFLRDRPRIVASLGQPLLFLFVFGGGLSPAMSSLGGGYMDFKVFMFPGILGMTVLFTSVFSAVSIVWDREFGFLKEVLVAPVSRTAVALGKVAGGSTVAMFQGAVILLLAPLIGVRLAAGQVFALLGLMLLLAAGLSSFGILIASRMRTMQGFQMIMQFLLMPMFFLSGAFFPLRNLPVWMDVLTKIDPLTYGVDPLRQVALSETVKGIPEAFRDAMLQQIRVHPIGTDILIMSAFWLAMIVPAIWAFNKQD